ncbi:MAG: 50S ribosomal protein L17 [Planctomycetes bacterium]|nr:50S ribosomal protein L17 [Planctomycetota bacterium]
MRHRCAGNRLGRTTSHRIAMTRNMANSVVLHERIITTLAKAKAIKPFVEKLVTLARKDTTPNRRAVFAELNDKESVKKLFAVIGPRFAKRDGGYCRILKLSKPRLGDNGARAILEFVERTPKEKAEPVAESAA